jgi:MerR family transcriptional regulator, light-induced transcriptional regulator
MPSIIDYPDDPKFNIKAVSNKTGIQAVTLRAWERRYKVLSPHRADNGYRLFSERDIALLTWLKTQIDSGMSISSAVLEFRKGSSRGAWPEAILNTRGAIPLKHSGVPASEISQKLYEMLIQHDEIKAEEVFSEALSSFELTPLFEMVISPVLTEIGEAWFNGKILIATEHFASNFFRAKLLAIFQSLPLKLSSAKIMVGGAPGELHEIGSLMMAVLLRNAGYYVEYLGPDLPLDDLVLYAADERPKMIILSATLKESALDLKSFQRQLSRIKPSPVFGFGGAAFNYRPELIDEVPGLFLGKTFSQSEVTVKSTISLLTKASLAG